jgi:1-deoxy-D-xylulose-5-phosphate synthase
VELARGNDKVVAITAAMPDGVGLDEFRKEFPSRYVDVGINESHAVAMAAGMARAGLRPVVAVYSTFMNRAFDQIFQEMSLQDLPVVLCMDRAGLVGSDGAVHHGFADISIMRPLPGMVLMAPADAGEMKQSLAFALAHSGPSAIRYPRDEAPSDIAGPCTPFELGRGTVVRTGADGTLLCYGTMLEPALAAADMLLAASGLRVGVVNARFAKPLDVPLVTRVISSGKPVLCCEEHAIAGGFGSAVLELAASRSLSTHNVRLLGLPDRYIPHASRQEQLAEVGLEPDNIAATIKEMIVGTARKLTSI